MASKQISELPALSATGQLSSTASFVVDQGSAAQSTYKVSFGEIKDAIISDPSNPVRRTGVFTVFGDGIISDDILSGGSPKLQITAWSDGELIQRWYMQNTCNAVGLSTVTYPIAYTNHLTHPIQFERTPVFNSSMTVTTQLTASTVDGLWGYTGESITNRSVTVNCAKKTNIMGYWIKTSGYVPVKSLQVGGQLVYRDADFPKYFMCGPGEYFVEAIGRGSVETAYTMRGYTYASGAYASGTFKTDGSCVFGICEVPDPNPSSGAKTQSRTMVSIASFNKNSSTGEYSLSAAWGVLNHSAGGGMFSFPGEASHSGGTGFSDLFVQGGLEQKSSDEYVINKTVVRGKTYAYGAGHGWEDYTSPSELYAKMWMESGFTYNAAVIITRLS